MCPYDGKRGRFPLAAIILFVVSLCILTGCGEKSAERKIGKEARYYITDKYGFRPKTTDVELRKVGELEGVWHKKDGGTANMEFEGRTFKVYVSLTSDIRYDDYLREDAKEYLNDFFSRELDCDDLHVWATYGVPVCMVPHDVKTVEDIFAKCDNVEIYVSTFGLDRESAKDLDLSALGADTKIDIIDWKDKECLEDEELMGETVVGLDTDSYTNGFSKIRSFYEYKEGLARSIEY